MTISDPKTYKLEKLWVRILQCLHAHRWSYYELGWNRWNLESQRSKLQSKSRQQEATNKWRDPAWPSPYIDPCKLNKSFDTSVKEKEHNGIEDKQKQEGVEDAQSSFDTVVDDVEYAVKKN